MVDRVVMRGWNSGTAFKNFYIRLCSMLRMSYRNMRPMRNQFCLIVQYPKAQWKRLIKPYMLKNMYLFGYCLILISCMHNERICKNRLPCVMLWHRNMHRSLTSQASNLAMGINAWGQSWTEVNFAMIISRLNMAFNQTQQDCHKDSSTHQPWNNDLEWSTSGRYLISYVVYRFICTNRNLNGIQS